MGKASSAKKVARAARAGGRTSGLRQRNLLFPGVIGLIVVLGVSLIAYAANDRKNDETVPPVLDDHWHAAYGVFVCDEFRPPIPEFENEEGIHTHGDGVIHIHPFTANGTGANATLGLFLRDTDIEISNDELRIGDETFKEGDQKCGDKDAEVVVAQWKDVQTTDANPARITSDMDDVRFREDGEGYVIAFVPEGTDIPKPESADTLAELGAVDAGGTTSTSAEGSTTTAPGSETTAPGSETTTTAGNSTTTAAG